MLTRLINNPLGSLVINVLFLSLLLTRLFFEIEVFGMENMEISMFKSSNYISNSWLVKCLIGVSYLLNTFLIINLNTKYKFIEFGSSPLLLFVLMGFMLCSIETLHLNVALAMLIGTFVLRTTLKIYHQSSIYGLIFAASLLTSVATILFFPSILFLLLIVFSFLIFRPFNIKDYALIAVGFLLPFFYLVTTDYLLDSNMGVYIPSFLFAKEPFAFWHRQTLLFLCFVGPLIIFSIAKVIVSQSKFVVQQRNQLMIVYLYLILLVIQSLMLATGDFWFFCLLPMGIFFTYWYRSIRRKWIIDITLILAIILSFFVK